MVAFQIVNGLQNRDLSSKMVAFQMGNGPQIHDFSSKMVAFQIRNGPQNRAKNVHFPNSKSHPSGNDPFSNSKWAPRSVLFIEKYRFSNGKWTTPNLRTSLQNRPSEFSNVSFWNGFFEKKVVKMLKAFGAHTDARTDKTNFLLTPRFKTPALRAGQNKNAGPRDH